MIHIQESDLISFMFTVHRTFVPATPKRHSPLMTHDQEFLEVASAQHVFLFPRYTVKFSIFRTDWLTDFHYLTLTKQSVSRSASSHTPASWLSWPLLHVPAVIQTAPLGDDDPLQALEAGETETERERERERRSLTIDAIDSWTVACWLLVWIDYMTIWLYYYDSWIWSDLIHDIIWFWLNSMI